MNRHTAFQMDFRNCDLTAYDLTNNQDMFYADFNTKTKFPEKLPKGFNPHAILESGKNPGLAVRELHKQGITGRHIGVGIIDQALLAEHLEYSDRLRLYEEIHCLDETVSMHAPAVASIAVGKTVGVAPGADLYFIGQTSGERSPGGKFEFDLSYIAQAIARLVEVNKQLPEGRKIRVISVSLMMVRNWKGYEQAVAAIQNAAQNGIFVITVQDPDFQVDGMGRGPLSDPDDKLSFSSGIMFGGNKWGSEKDVLQVPMDSRTVADPNGNEDYCFSRVGGQSWTTPWVAGLYALACQVYPELTPKEFRAAALQTADAVTFKKGDNTYTLQKVVNPVRLIEKVKKQRGKGY
ncbi:MAG: S8 family serine peptidase [Elusimicrobiales bacterium]